MEEQLERSIYVIAASEAGPVKIGVSSNAEKRLQQLQTGHDKRLVLYANLPCRATHAFALEQLIHSQLSLKRLVGEWFAVDVETAVLEAQFGIIRWESDEKLDRQIKKKNSA